MRLLTPLLLSLLAVIGLATLPARSEEGPGSSRAGDADHTLLTETAPAEEPHYSGELAAPTHSEADILQGLDREGDELVLALYRFNEETPSDLSRFVYGPVNTFVEGSTLAREGNGAAAMTFYRNPDISGNSAYFHVLFNPSRGRVSDWSPFRAIGGYLYNTEQFPVTLHVVLGDEAGNRAVQRITLEPGQWFDWQWPLQKAVTQGVDLTKIKRLSFKQNDTEMTDINTVLVDKIHLRGPNAGSIVAMLEKASASWSETPIISAEPKAAWIPRIDASAEAKELVRKRFGKEVDGVIKTQVLVVGGGMAGTSASIGSARTGVDTLLVEGLGFLGGMGTAAMVYPWMPSKAGGEQIIEGVFMDYFKRLQRLDAASRAPGNDAVINFDKEALKMVLQEEVIDSGSQLLLHTWVGEALMDDTIIRGVLGYNKSGTIAILAERVVDCTGDGDVAVAAGAEYEQGRGFDIYGQACTLFFRMGNVDYSRAFSEQNRRLTRYEQQIPAEYLFADLFTQAKAEGVLDANLPISSIYFEKTLNPGVVSINATRVFEVDTTSALDLTYAEVESRRQVQQLSNFLIERIPGFEKAFLQETAVTIGVRESRRIVGDYMLTGEDVIHATKFPDAIARGSFGIDIHCADYTGCGIAGLDLEEGSSYDIPYRTLVPKTIENLLVGGRCISVTHIAFGSSRIQPVASATGQAAGIAAAESVKENVTPRQLAYSRLRPALLAQHVNLGDGKIPLVATRTTDWQTTASAR